MIKFNLRNTILLVLPAFLLVQGCEKKKDTKKNKSDKKAQIEARSAMPECQGQIDACMKLDQECNEADDVCVEKVFNCLDKVPDNCFPSLGDNMEDSPEGWVDFFEVCFKDPRLDDCFTTYDGCIDNGTDEQSCFEAMDKCIEPLVTDECKELDAGEPNPDKDELPDEDEGDDEGAEGEEEQADDDQAKGA